VLTRASHNLLTIRISGGVPPERLYGSDDGQHFDRIDRDLPERVDRVRLVAVTPGAANHFAVTKTIVNDRAGSVREVFFGASNEIDDPGVHGKSDRTGAPDRRFDEPSGRASATDRSAVLRDELRP
jgi:hypothetical protein